MAIAHHRQIIKPMRWSANHFLWQFSTALANASYSEKIPVFDGLGNPGQFLVDNASCAELVCPTSSCPHLSVWEANVHTGSANQGV